MKEYNLEQNITDLMEKVLEHRIRGISIEYVATLTKLEKKDVQFYEQYLKRIIKESLPGKDSATEDIAGTTAGNIGREYHFNLDPKIVGGAISFYGLNTHTRPYTRTHRIRKSKEIQELIKKGANTTGEVCSLSGISVLTLKKYAEDFDIDISGLEQSAWRNELPELETLIKEQRLSPREMGRIVGLSHESVRQYMLDKGGHVYKEWKEKYQEYYNGKIRDRSDKVAELGSLTKVLMAKASNDANKESWQFQTALEYVLSKNFKWNEIADMVKKWEKIFSVYENKKKSPEIKKAIEYIISVQRLKPSHDFHDYVKVFEKYFHARAKGENRSLYELCEGTSFIYSQVSRVLRQVGLEPMNPAKGTKHADKVPSIKRAFSSSVPVEDCAYFLDIPEPTLSKIYFGKMGKRSKTVRAFATFGNKWIKRRTASMIFEAKDAGFDDSLIAEYVGEDNGIVRHCLHNRKDFQNRIVNDLRQIYDNNMISLPYHPFVDGRAIKRN